MNGADFPHDAHGFFFRVAPSVGANFSPFHPFLGREFSGLHLEGRGAWARNISKLTLPPPHRPNSPEWSGGGGHTFSSSGLAGGREEKIKVPSPFPFSPRWPDRVRLQKWEGENCRKRCILLLHREKESTFLFTLFSLYPEFSIHRKLPPADGAFPSGSRLFFSLSPGPRANRAESGFNSAVWRRNRIATKVGAGDHFGSEISSRAPAADSGFPGDFSALVNFPRHEQHFCNLGCLEAHLKEILL